MAPTLDLGLYHGGGVQSIGGMYDGCAGLVRNGLARSRASNEVRELDDELLLIVAFGSS